MKLTIKHIAPYLPYQLTFYRPYLIYTGGENPQPDHEEYGADEVTLENVQRVIDSGFPLLLKSLQDLTNDDIDNSPYVTFNELREEILNNNCPHWIWLDKVEQHFDVFGLIDAGIAIDINTI